jgi:hypothetical protein
MTSTSLATARRSLRLAVKNFQVADADADRFMTAARACWEQGLELPPAVKKLRDIADASEARCTPAAKRLLNAFINDQPLPGYLEELRHLGTLWHSFDIAFVLSEIDALEEEERVDNRLFREQISGMGFGLRLI